MRTSLEIPDPVFRAAKRLALERGTTLKQLVAEGLERVLAEAGGDAPAAPSPAPAASPAPVPLAGRTWTGRPDAGRLPRVRPRGEGRYQLSGADIDAILAGEEAARGGRAR